MSTAVKYIHTDQLGTPRFMTNTSGTLLWYWHSDPFGVGSPTVITNGSTYYLGMPGQYYDPEDQLYYNGARYYWAKIGRYYESDPIGLDGGVNTYAYAGENPILYFDFNGLDWIYSQSTGTLTHVDIYGNPNYVATGGYSGNGIGVNNTNLQFLPDVGPIPQGFYTIGPEQTNYTSTGKTLPNSMRLTPLLEFGNNIFGRNGFLIHGSNDYSQQNSSNGCVIFPKNVRDKIGSSGDNSFIVVP